MILNNLYNQAVSLIPTQSGTLFVSASRTKNARGQFITTFDAGVPITGSFQAVPRSLYKQNNFDAKKVYYTLYATQDVKGLLRGGRGDQIEYSGKRFQIQTEGGWKPVDDWTGVLLVEVLNDG